MAKTKTIRRGFLGFLLLALVAALFAYFNFSTVVVSGPSMEPTFYTGRRLLVSHAWWLVGPIHDNEIVVVQDDNPDGYIIKRVYKMGGEAVDFANAPKGWLLKDGAFVVPQGKIFLLGDNREKSEDSRAFGPVANSKVLGKVLSFK